MEDKSKWSKFTDDLSEVVDKFQDKMEEDKLVEDLQESIRDITENTKNILKS